MGFSKENITFEANDIKVTNSKRRRLRRKKLHASLFSKTTFTNINNIDVFSVEKIEDNHKRNLSLELSKPDTLFNQNNTDNKSNIANTNNSEFSELNNKEQRIMSSKESNEKSRNDVLAAREAKKLAKQKGKKKGTTENNAVMLEKPENEQTSEMVTQGSTEKILTPDKKESVEKKTVIESNISINRSPKSKDEVDRADINVNKDLSMDDSKAKPRELVKAERVARKASKQANKKGGDGADVPVTDMTVKDVVNTLKDIVIVAREVQAVTAKVEAIDLGAKKSEDCSKSKADLKAERRAKQEAQRAAKQAAQQQKAPVKQEPTKVADKEKEEKSPKPKTVEKSTKPKCQTVQKINWLHDLRAEQNREETLRKIAINSNLHPAIVKLGVQLASRVITGSNARCIALLDALKKVVRDYSLPARTEFARGLEACVSRCAAFLWTLRQPGAAQLNALAHLRRHLTQLPADVHEFDAKKRLQEEIDRYIREQIDMAGEAISIAVRNKISNGDNILTYGCSSLIERILCDAHAAGITFRAVVAGTRVQRDARELLRRLVACGVSCSYVDITALSFVMKSVSKVVIGAESLLANGSVVGAAGSLATALAARAHNVPVLVACETHKFSDRARATALVTDDLGDPDDLIDKTDENSPLKDWRSNPNLTLLNLTYDVTPPSLVTAVVTELAILPCTSAPVVLRYKLSEYGL